MPSPVFVVGKERSGTTWLANLLCGHPQAAGVCHEKHFGIHESAFFSHVDGRYGDLSEWVNYVEFVRVMSATDYFRLAGADEQLLFSLWPTTYEDVFRTIMDRLAEREAKTHWVEKTPAHSLCLERIAGAYPDAVFVAIYRDAEEVVSSTLGMYAARDSGVAEPGRVRRATIRNTVLSWRRYYKAIDVFAAHSDRILKCRYAALREDPKAVLAEVCDFVGLPYAEQMHDQPYKPNTGFGDASKRARKLSDAEKRRIRRLSRLSAVAPRSVLGWLAAVRARRRERPILPRSFFRLLPATLSVVPRSAQQEGDTIDP